MGKGAKPLYFSHANNSWLTVHALVSPSLMKSRQNILQSCRSSFKGKEAQIMLSVSLEIRYVTSVVVIFTHIKSSIICNLGIKLFI